MTKQKWIFLLGTNEKVLTYAYLVCKNLTHSHRLIWHELLPDVVSGKTKEEKSKLNSSSTVFLCIDVLIIFKLTLPCSYVYLNGQPEPYVLSSFAASLAVSE